MKRFIKLHLNNSIIMKTIMADLLINLIKKDGFSKNHYIHTIIGRIPIDYIHTHSQINSNHHYISLIDYIENPFSLELYRSILSSFQKYLDEL